MLYRLSYPTINVAESVCGKKTRRHNPTASPNRRKGCTPVSTGSLNFRIVFGFPALSLSLNLDCRLYWTSPIRLQTSRRITTHRKPLMPNVFKFEPLCSIVGVCVTVFCLLATVSAAAYTPDSPLVVDMVERGTKFLENGGTSTGEGKAGEVMLVAYTHHKVRQDPNHPLIRRGLASLRNWQREQLATACQMNRRSTMRHRSQFC